MGCFGLFSEVDFKFGDSMQSEKYEMIKTELLYGYYVEVIYDPGSDNDRYQNEHILGEVKYSPIRFQDKLEFVDAAMSYIRKKYNNITYVPYYLTISSNLIDEVFRSHLIKEKDEIDIEITFASFKSIMERKVPGVFTFMLKSLYIFINDEKYSGRIVIIPFDKIATRTTSYEKFIEKMEK